MAANAQYHNIGKQVSKRQTGATPFKTIIRKIVALLNTGFVQVDFDWQRAGFLALF